MAKTAMNSIRLGVFVLAGVLVLVVILYMVGQNRHLFGASYSLKAQFLDAQGLVEGNNVRFSGINVGTVKRIAIRGDAVIEVTMLIDKEMAGIIRNNAFVSIGTEGLVGNKVVNITPSEHPGPLARDGDVLASKALPDIESMMETLQGTNNDVAVIAAELRTTVQKMNKSPLWTLLSDERVPADIRTSLVHIRDASSNAADFAAALDEMAGDIRAGRGTIGMLLADTSFSAEMRETIISVRQAGMRTETLVRRLDTMAATLHEQITAGSGPVYLLFKDSAAATNINASLENIRKGTEGFSQNMEALKHNFLLRGYFRRQEQNSARQRERSR